MRLATTWLCVCLLATGFAQGQEPEPQPRIDPLHQLAQALRASLRGPAPRDAQLRVAVERLHSLDDLRAALLLTGWRDRDPDENLAIVDARHRAVVVGRFQRELRAALRQPELDSRLSALKIIAGLDLRMLGNGETPLARDFTADVVEMTRTGPVTLRELAARTLGKIDAEPTVAAAALGALLRDPEPRLRIVAAESLGNLTTTALRLSPAGVCDEHARTEAVAAGCAALPVAVGGLNDAAAEVRLACVEVLASAAQALAHVVAEPPDSEELDDWTAYQTDVEQERETVRPLIAALKDQSQTLARAAADGDSRVRIAARHALESVAGARLRLMARASSAVAPPEGQGDAEVAARSAKFLLDDPLLAELRQALPALTAGVDDADVESRRAAIDVLEAMGRNAAPATPALVGALTDRDRFVRWSAARALGKVRPGDAEAVVAALARLLGDGDCDVRIAAAGALTAYGPGARAALPALVTAAQAREPELRLAAVRALDRIGSQDTAALAVLNAALSDGDPRVRRTAEEALLRPSPRNESPMKTVGSVQPR
jgi:HEAT repeat protein